MAQQIQLRRGTASAWTSANPTLAQGEMGFETDTIKVKLGDGTTAWNSLAYYSFGMTNPMTALGDTIYGGSSGVPTKLLGPTTNGTYVLTSVPTAGTAVAPTWTLSSSLGYLTSASSLNASNISSGTVGITYLPTGTTSTTVALGNHNHTVDSLSNVTITSKATNDLLQWNGTAWVNKTISGAGLQPAGSYLTSYTETSTLANVTSRGSTTADALTFTNTTDTTTLSNGALVISGGLNVIKNMNVQKDLFVGASAITQTSVTINPSIIAKDAGSNYAQIAMINSSSTGSSDFAAYGDNGSDASGWVDMGFTGSGFNDANYNITGKNDGYVFAQAVSGTGLTGNLVFATGGNGTTNDIVFATGGFTSSPTNYEKMRFIHSTGQLDIETTTTSSSTSTGALRVRGGVGIAGATYIGGGISLSGASSPLSLNGSVGTSGQFLTSAGAGATPTWTSRSGASSVVVRDANQNIQVNNIQNGYTSTASSATTLTLTAASSYVQRITGTIAQTIQLPDTTTLTNGNAFIIDNDSTLDVTVNTSTATFLDTVSAGSLGYFFVEDNTVNTIAGWGRYGFIPGSVDWGSSSVTFSSASSITTSSSTAGDTPALTISTGSTSFTTGTTGAININTPAPTGSSASSSGNLTISTGNASGSTGGSGGTITLLAGNGAGSGGVGGSININAGTAVTTGSVNIGTTSGNITIGRTASGFAPKLPTPFINTSQTSLTATATITAANVLTKNVYLITATTAVTFTLDTGTAFETGFGNPAVGSTVEWFIINEGTSAATITMAGGTNHTFRGTTTIATATAAKFITRKSATNIFFTYRV